jgi:homoserine O-acetyltransferase
MQGNARRYFTFADDGQGMELDNGNRLGPVTLAYETYGTLNAEKDNAILILHAFSGDAHVASHPGQEGETGSPGWWEVMVGPGKAIDTGRYFVICSNILGSCMGSTGPSSENPATKAPYGLDFPVVTIGDMVRAQKTLIDHLQISKLLAVIGGSVGGMQALQWCVSYPQMVRSAIPLATTMRHSAQAIAFNEIARQAIMADPKWRLGNYGDSPPELGLAVARMIGHVTYLSDEALRRKFGRRLQDRSDFSFNFESDFQVESYLRYQGAKFVRRFDANSFLYITKAADYFDLTGNKEGGIVGLADTSIRFLVISFSSDWLYPTYQSKDLVRALKRDGLNVSFCEIKADCGHDAFLIKNDRLNEMISGFLNGVMVNG